MTPSNPNYVPNIPPPNFICHHTRLGLQHMNGGGINVQSVIVVYLILIKRKKLVRYNQDQWRPDIAKNYQRTRKGLILGKKINQLGLEINSRGTQAAPLFTSHSERHGKNKGPVQCESCQTSVVVMMKWPRAGYCSFCDIDTEINRPKGKRTGNQQKTSGQQMNWNFASTGLRKDTKHCLYLQIWILFSLYF